jgi:putative mycofactocin binding protein MftB
MRSYPLADGIKARRESFGLLFYNSKTTSLTFVHSGNLFEVAEEGTLFAKEEGTRFTSALFLLINKGLVRDHH